MGAKLEIQIPSEEKYGDMVSGASEPEQKKNKGGCGNTDGPQEPEQAQIHNWEKWLRRV